MSDLLSRTISRAQHEAQRHCGDQTFPWQGQDIPCIPSSLMAGTAIEVGGNPIEIALSLNALSEDFADPAGNALPLPVSGELLPFEGITYRVLKVGSAGVGNILTIHLCDKDSGR